MTTPTAQEHSKTELAQAKREANLIGLRITALEQAGGDVDRAQRIYKFLTDGTSYAES